MSTNGWTSNDIGLRWLNDVFLPETAAGDETRILLIDGHGSHATPQFMTKCAENNVKPIYLLPHSSHVLQPLDLACFSVVKSRYRDQIANLSRFEDSAQVKKIRFIQYYNTARKEGLTSSTIKSGWRAAGIVPWDPRKVIRSSQVPQEHTQAVPQTPRRKQRLSTEGLYTTPQNRRDFERLASLLPASIETNRTIRTVLQKASKAIDRFHHQSVIQSRTMKAYEIQIQEHKNKRRKKVAIDANETFATVEKIIATKAVVALNQPVWDEQQKVQEARRTANVMIANQLEAFTHQFHINEVVG